MKEFSLRLISALMVLISVISCTSSKERKVSHDIWLPWQNENGQYTIQKIPVNTVDQWTPLRGSAAQVRSHVNRIAKNTYSSQEVMLEYTHDKSGALIPSTQFSAEVASIYAHLERLQKLDMELELPQATKARKVYVNFIEELEYGEILVDNAFYDASIDSFFVVPYRQGKLPLTVNGAVLAHEHFHSIFARLLIFPMAKLAESKGAKFPGLLGLQPHSANFSKFLLKYFQLGEGALVDSGGIKLDPSSTPFLANKIEFLNRTMFRGLNEGLADVWGWLYSSDPCFMAPSFDDISTAERCLKVEPRKLQLTTTEALGSKYSSVEGVTAQANKYGYELGSNLAQLIYLRLSERGELANLDAKRKWAKRIVDTLPTFLPHLTKVIVDEQMRSSVLQWEKTVDTLVFGPGSLPVPKEFCPRWNSILSNKAGLEYFRTQCSQ